MRGPISTILTDLEYTVCVLGITLWINLPHNFGDVWLFVLVDKIVAIRLTSTALEQRKEFHLREFIYVCVCFYQYFESENNR